MHNAIRIAIGLVTLLAAPLGAAPPRVGINLSGVVYYASQHPFVDEFKQSQPWGFQKEGAPYGKGDRQPLRADGYPASLVPGQYVDSILAMDPDFPPGEYVLLYDGKGDVDARGDAKVTGRREGRLEVTIEPKDHQLSVRLTRTDPNDPVRNIRFVPRAAEATYLKRPFREGLLRPWRGLRVLRFMDWQSTNGSEQREWADRATPEFQTQGSGRGVAVEYLVDLAKTLSADPWFCIPHLASDDYVRQFVTLVKQRLAPGRTVYVEYSNERWNGAFAQARYCGQQGKALGLSDNAYQAQLLFCSRRSGEVFAIFEQVFGGKDRIVRVLASQHENPWASERVLGWNDAWKHADGLAVAPYFGHDFGNPKNVEATLALGVEGCWRRAGRSSTRTTRRLRSRRSWQKHYRLQLVAYEGGPHLVGIGGAENNERLTALFTAVNRDAKMNDLYLRDFTKLWDAGGGLFVAYASTARPSKWGNWGVLEFDGQKFFGGAQVSSPQAVRRSALPPIKFFQAVATNHRLSYCLKCTATVRLRDPRQPMQNDEICETNPRRLEKNVHKI